jgi:hypothetical protein
MRSGLVSFAISSTHARRVLFEVSEVGWVIASDRLAQRTEPRTRDQEATGNESVTAKSALCTQFTRACHRRAFEELWSVLVHETGNVPER